MHFYNLSLRLLAYSIAALAGFMDAIGFITANGYFVSFMSGNSTRLGVHVGADIPTRFATGAAAAITPALLILGFVCGVILGTIVADRAGNRHKSAILALSSGCIALSAFGYEIDNKLMTLGGAVVAMGAINNAFRRNGEVVVGVTYMTGALVRFAQGIGAWIAGRHVPGTLANLGLWASLTAGATTGAFFNFWSPAVMHWTPLPVALMLLVAAAWIERRTEREPSLED